MRFTMFQTLQRLQSIKNKRYTWKEIADTAGVHVNTITRVANDETDRVDFKTLEGLMHFFEKEGMPVGLGDLLVVTKKAAD